MSSSGPASCATGSVSRPSRIAARAIATASIASDLPRSRAACARRPSASAPPARRARRARAGSAPARPRRAGSPRSPTPARSPSAARPAQQILERPPLAPHRPLGEHATGRRVDRRDRVRALVRVRPDHDHLHRPFVGITDERIAGGHISVGAMPRSYQVTPAILGRRRATQHRSVRPTGRQKVNESARRRARGPTGRVGRHRPTSDTLALRKSSRGGAPCSARLPSSR